MKAFTFVQLIVSMAVVSTLFTMAIVGISTTQRVARDTERKEVLKAISNELLDYYGNFRRYPPAAVFAWDSANNTVSINSHTLRLSGATTLLVSPAGAASSTVNGSVYCYVPGTPANKFSLGVSLESGGWYNLGDDTPCSARSF